MVSGIEYEESEPKGRPSERFDGSEIRDDSGYGISPGDYEDHGEFEMPEDEVIEVFHSIMETAEQELKTDEPVTDGGRRFNYVADYGSDFPDMAGTGIKEPQRAEESDNYMGFL